MENRHNEHSTFITHSTFKKNKYMYIYGIDNNDEHRKVKTAIRIYFD